MGREEWLNGEESTNGRGIRMGSTKWISFSKNFIIFALNQLSSGSNVQRVQQDRVRNWATRKLIFYGGDTMINWVELSRGSSCLVSRVVSWVELSRGLRFFLGRVVTRVELSHGHMGWVVCVKLSHGSRWLNPFITQSLDHCASNCLSLFCCYNL